MDWGRRDLREGGGNYLKYLRRGWNKKKKGRGHKYFKKGRISWVKGWVP